MHDDGYISSIDDLAEREASRTAEDSQLRNVAQLQTVILEGFMEHLPRIPRYAVAGLVPLRHVTLLSAHGGSGKSILALAWCAHVACGQVWAGRTMRGPAKAVFVSLEDEAGLVVDRLRRIVDQCNLNEGMVSRNVRILDGTATDGAMVFETAGRKLIPTAIMGEVEAASVDAALVIIDNASDAFAGDEINRRQVRSFVSHLAAIARESDCGMVLIAHVDKMSAKHGGNGNTYSGSTAWHNSARSRLALVDSDGLIELRQEKHNLGKLADPIALKFTDAGVIIPCARTDASSSVNDEQRNAMDCDKVFKTLQAAGEAGVAVPANTSGPATGWHALQLLPELPAEYRTKEGKARVHAALVRLCRETRIIRESYVGSNRNTRERYVLTQTLTQGA